MRLAFVSPTYFSSESAIGGGERYVFELSLAMSRHADVELISFGKATKTVNLNSHLKLNVHKAWCMQGNIANPLNLSFLSDLKDAAIIHCFQYNTIIANLSTIYAKVFGKKVFATDLGGGGPNFSKRLKLGKHVDALLLISRFSANAYEEYAFKVEVIYGGVDAKRFRPLNVDKEERTLFVGRLGPHKGVNYLVEAMPKRVALKIIGTGILDRGYYNYLLRLSEGKSVQFCNIGRTIGSLDADHHLAREYSSAIVTVLPSVYCDVYGNYSPAPELIGLSLLESYACGTPVIATNVGGLPEVVKEGETGFIVPPNNAKALRERIRYFMDNPSESIRMGKEGRRLVEERFTWDHVARRCWEAYRKF